MHFSKHRRAIERLYEDRATISRTREIEAPNGATRDGLVPLYTDQSCRVSQKQLAVNGQTEAQNDIRYEVKLFIAPELVILQGDVVHVTRGKNTPDGWIPIAAVREYTAGEPFPYSTHQEVSLQRDGYA